MNKPCIMKRSISVATLSLFLVAAAFPASGRSTKPLDIEDDPQGNLTAMRDAAQQEEQPGLISLRDITDFWRTGNIAELAKGPNPGLM